jgi:hypothetical protein
MSGVESWIKAPKSGWTGNPAPGAIVEWRNAAGSKGTYLSDDVAGLGQPLNGNSPIKAYRVVTPAALSAIEGGGGSLQPSASVPTEQADGGVLDRDWLVKIIREHSFAQDAADMIIGAMRSATPPATPIAGGFGSSAEGADTHRVAETAVLGDCPGCGVAPLHMHKPDCEVMAARRDEGAGQ